MANEIEVFSVQPGASATPRQGNAIKAELQLEKPVHALHTLQRIQGIRFELQQAGRKQVIVLPAFGTGSVSAFIDALELDGTGRDTGQAAARDTAAQVARLVLEWASWPENAAHLRAFATLPDAEKSELLHGVLSITK